jgi:hypothetical protein
VTATSLAEQRMVASPRLPAAIVMVIGLYWNMHVA